MARFYRVGGCVRDELLGMKSKDVDYAVEAPTYEAMRQAILDRGGKIFLETPQFVTIRATVPKLGVADFVLCRKEGTYSDQRHPDWVEPGTIEDDLSRRDFTVNAIAVSEEGEYIDPFGGRQDLAQRLLRCVRNARDRFEEDPLRLLRAIRFSITRDLHLDADVVKCLSTADLVGKITTVSVERIREELLRCFQHSTPRTLAVLDQFPELRRVLFDKTGIWLKPTLERP